MGKKFHVEKTHPSRKERQVTWQPPPATTVYLAVVSCAEAFVRVLHFMQHQAQPLRKCQSARPVLTSYLSLTKAQGWERAPVCSHVVVSLPKATPNVLPLQRRPQGTLSSLLQASRNHNL